MASRATRGSSRPCLIWGLIWALIEASTIQPEIGANHIPANADDQTDTVITLVPTTSYLGRYLVERPIGAGGMGEVYRARGTRLERTVAIKVLPRATADDRASRRRLLN